MATARSASTAFIYPSSGSIYGSAARDVALIDEDALHPAPVSLYGLTKRAAETILPRVAETQGMRFAAARLGSVYGPWEYATGVRDTLSPMLQVMQCARRGEEAVLGPAWRGDFIYLARCRRWAGAAGRCAGPVAHGLQSGQRPARLGGDLVRGDWRRLAPGFRWRHGGPGEAGNVDSHTGFHRGPMEIAKIARDTGYAPQLDLRHGSARRGCSGTPPTRPPPSSARRRG